MKSCQNNQFEIVKYLNEHGADINAHSKIGNSALMFAF
jgi:ankyrin repeat protein